MAIPSDSFAVPVDRDQGGASDGGMNILMVNPFWDPAEEGGVNMMADTLTAALRRRNHRVFGLADDWSCRTLRPGEGKGGIELGRLRLTTPRLQGRALARWLLDLPAVLRQLRGMVRDRRIHVAHLHYAGPWQYLFRLLRLFGGPPYVVTLHGSDVANLPALSPFDRGLVAFALAGASRTVAISRPLAELLRRNAPNGRFHLDVVPNGIDLDAVRTVTATGSGFDRPALPRDYGLMVANFNPVKGHDVAIRAWRLLRAERPDLHLVIVGDTLGGQKGYRAECERLIGELGCSGRVHCIGPLAHGAALEAMRHARVVVIPSRSEGGICFVLQEAGALGRPVVCAGVPAFREFVADGVDGLLFPTEDATALADAVLRLERDAALGGALADSLMRKVQARFSSDEMARAYEGIYRAALAGRNRA